MTAMTIKSGAWTVCQNQDPELWFPAKDDERGAEIATRLCGICPALDACRQAVDDLESKVGLQDGVWAGETPAQRKRRRGGRKPRMCQDCGCKLGRSRSLERYCTNCAARHQDHTGRIRIADVGLHSRCAPSEAGGRIASAA